jgi:hypothetical protein
VVLWLSDPNPSPVPDTEICLLSPGFYGWCYSGRVTEDGGCGGRGVLPEEVVVIVPLKERFH